MALIFAKQALKDIESESKEIQQKLLILFRKKTQKTPLQEIETAIKRYKLLKG